MLLLGTALLPELRNTVITVLQPAIRAVLQPVGSGDLGAAANAKRAVDWCVAFRLSSHIGLHEARLVVGIVARDAEEDCKRATKHAAKQSHHERLCVQVADHVNFTSRPLGRSRGRPRRRRGWQLRRRSWAWR